MLALCLLLDMWVVHAQRPGEGSSVQETVHRQGTAYRRARQLYAAGYEVRAIELSIDDPPVPLAAYRFDGIRFARVPGPPKVR